MNHDCELPTAAFILLNKAYPTEGWLTKMNALRSKPLPASLPNIEPHCAGGNDFDRIQTQYHGIPEHLIAARDHD
jgi:hypothetical protein